MRRLNVLAIIIAGLCSAPLSAQPTSVQSATQAAEDTANVPPVVPVDSSAPILVFPQPAGLSLSRASVARWSLQDTTRRKAVTYSEWYGRRLRVHRYGSYAMLPLFATQYVLGNKLLKQKEAQYANTRLTPIDKNLKTTHAVVAGGVGALFVVNTTTGLWNLFDSRHTVPGRKLRTIHALTMLAADAGFAYTGYLSSKAVDHGPPEARKHRNMALVSFGIATTGASLMWFRRD
ncbi:MAG: hypothetical protein ABJB74_00425 [Gemmatimonas sp.]